MDKDENDLALSLQVAAVRPSALLEVTGEDALAFLQGQFTQELRPDRAPPVAYGLWLNQKGKVLADSYVIRLGADRFWVVSWTSAASVIQERLEAYVIADDVVLTDQTTMWEGRVLFPAAAAAWLAANGLAPPGPGGWIEQDGLVAFASRRGVEGMLDVMAPVDAATALPAANATPEVLERLRLRAGVPSIPQDVGETDLPNEAGLEETALSFTKGCYLGQEVMARLKSMGRVRRRLLRVAGAGAPPPTGARLRQGDVVVGELRSVAADGGGGWAGLAMMSLVHFRPEGPAPQIDQTAVVVTLAS
jgi:tRNA-modifying protein YgfZ